MLDVQGLEDLDLLLHRQLGGVAGEVGQSAELADPLDGLRDLGRADRLGDVLDRAAVVARKLSRAVGVVAALDRVFDLDPGGVAGPGDAGADHRATHAADDHRVHAVLEAPDVLDRRDCSDARVARLEAGDQDELAVALAGRGDRGLGLGRLEHERDHHARQDDPGGQRKER